MNIIKSKVLMVVCLLFIALVSLSTAAASDLNDTDSSLKETNLDVEAVNVETVDVSNDIETNVASSEGADNNTLLASSNDENELKADSGTFSELRGEIGRISQGGTLSLQKDYDGSGSAIQFSNNDITIDGQNHILDAKGYSRIFSISGNNVTLKNIVFKNGNMSGSGGAIYATSNLNIINCTFENNLATSQGGAIYSIGNSYTLNIYNSTFDLNAANFHGGAISSTMNINIENTLFTNNTVSRSDGGGGAISSKKNLNISNSTFRYNKAQSYGGAINANCNADLKDCTFEYNDVGSYGGSIYFNGNNYVANIYNNTFKSNSASSHGGAIYGGFVNGYLNIYESDFINNSVSSHGMSEGGGAIITINSNVLYINNSCFKYNSAPNSEGGCVRHSATTVIENCIFDSNVAKDGAAVCSGHNVGTATLTNNTYINNFAYRWGGALQERNAYVTGSIFKNNTVDLSYYRSDEFGAYGGAILVRDSIEITDCSFEDCVSRRGGAIYFEKRTAIANINNCTFKNNTAIEYGGAITAELQGGTVTITDSNFTKNQAPSGGAIHISKLKGFGTVRVISSNFYENNANVSSGGAIFSDAGVLDISYSNFTKNHAIDDGGAISTIGVNIRYSRLIENDVSDCGGALYSTSTTELNNVFFDKNTALYGGAVYASHIIGSYINATNNGAIDGAAIYLDGQTSTENTIERSSFAYNNASHDGGAVFINVGRGSVSNSDFNYNYAGNDAGALFWNRGEGRLTRNTFKNNKAEKDGGAVHWAADGGNLETSTFNNNTAGSRGGAVYWGGSRGKVMETTFTMNHGAEGEDLYWRGILGEIQESTFGPGRASNALYWHGADGNIISNTFNDARICVCGHANVNLERNTQTSSSISGYSITNNGTIELFKNNFYNAIYNGGIIKSPTSIEVLNNRTILTNDSSYDVYTAIVDDNGNYIKLDSGLNNSYVGNVYAATFNNTHYLLELPNVQLGVNVISLSGDYSSLQSTALKSGTLIYMLLVSNVTVINYGESVIVTATLVNTTENGTVKIYINDQEYEADLVNGTATLVLHDVAPNDYTVTVAYEKYNQTVTSYASFDIQLRDSNLTITVNNITAGENNTVYINVTNGTTGSIYVFINGDMYIRQLVNSTAQVELSDVAGGTYNVYAVYNGNNYFKDCYGSAVFTATKTAPTFIITAQGNVVGQSCIIEITGTEDIAGDIYVHVDGVAYSFTKMPISFTVANLTAGIHNVIVGYNGDDKYFAGNNNTTFSVAKKNLTMSVTTKFIVVGDNETIEITVPEDADGIILVDLNGTPYYIYAENGTATLTVPDLKYGAYEVTVTYREDDKYVGKSVSSQFNVDYVEIDPEIDYDVDEDLRVIVNVTVPGDANGDVIIEVEGKNYTAPLVKGKASIPVNDLEGGEHDAKLYFENDTKYASTTKDFVLKLSKVNVKLHIDAPTIFVEENATITVTVAPDAAGVVAIRINNNVYTANVTDGNAVFTVSGLAAGAYEIHANYTGDRKYLFDEVDGDLVVSKVDLSATSYMNASSIYVGETAVVYITMPDDASGIVNLTIQNKVYELIIENGRGQISIPGLTHGVPVPIFAQYSGSDKYLPGTRLYTDFAVHRISNYNVEIEATTNESAANITVTIPSDANGPGYITINNKTYNVVFKDGVANITAVNLTAGEKYEVYAYFDGDDTYTENDAVKTLNSNKTLDYEFEISVGDILVGQTAYITIYLPNATVNHDKINVTVEGPSVSRNVDNNTMKYPVYGLDAGSHRVIVTYWNSDKYETRSRYATISVSKINFFNLRIDVNTPYVNENVTFNMTLPDDADGEINVTINHKTYPAEVRNGTAYVIADALPAGSYNATVFYSGNDKYNNRTQYVTVNVLKIKEFTFTMNVSDIFVGENETIRIYLPAHIDGNVTVTISNTSHVNVPVPVSGGVGSISIPGLDAGRYEVIATLHNDTIYESESIRGVFLVSTISDYDINVTYNASVNVRDNITFTVNLPEDANGYVNLTIFNKTHKVKITNGTGTINNITAESEGTFSFAASFQQEGKYEYKSQDGYVLVTKVNVVLDPIYKGTVVVDENVTFTVNLPSDATGNITIVSRGMIFTAELVNGSANVTMVGYPVNSVYSPVISYDGDDKYNPTSLTTKITVEKVSDYDLNVVVSDITVEQDEIVNITLPSDATDDVLISGNFSTETVSRLITNGTASYIISNLPAGTYNITVRYQGYSKYGEKSVTRIFTVSKVVPPMSVEFVNNDTIVVTLPDNAFGHANVTVGDILKEKIEIENGRGLLDVSVLRPGDYFVNVTFSGGVRYLPANNNTTITIPKIKDYALPVSVEDIIVGENATIIVSLPEHATGHVNLTINGGETIPVEIGDGLAVYNASGLKVGNYTVDVKYSCGEYELQTNSSEFTVYKIKTVIREEVDGNSTHITVKVTLTEGVTGNVTITVDRVSQTFENIDSNVLSYTVPSIPGEHDIAISYSGDENHTDASKSAYIETYKISDYGLTVEAESLITVLDSNVITVTLPKGIEGNVRIHVNGLAYAPAKVNSTTGKATLTLPRMEFGNYTVTASFYNDVYDFKENTTNFTVIKLNTTISAEAQNITKNQEASVKIILNESAGGNVFINAGVRTYYVAVEEGIAIVPFANLNEGTYTLEITYEGDNFFNGNFTTVQFTVSKIPFNITISGSDIIEGNGLVLNINASANITDLVTVNINNENHTVILYSGNGTLTVYGLEVGPYNATVYYPGDDNYVSANDTVLINVNPKLESAITVNVNDTTVGENAMVYVNVTEGATGSVTILVAGDAYTKQLDENGTAIFTFDNLTARPYHVTAIYNGDNVYGVSNSTDNFVVYKKGTSIEVEVTNATVGSVEVITVKVNPNATGTVLLNASVSTYYSNVVDGVATFNVTGLLVGDHIIDIKYIGDDSFNENETQITVTTSKIETLINITPAENVVTVGKPVTFTIETSQNITDLVHVEIGGENYTAFVVDGKGSLTVYGLGIGNYTAVVYYSGDDRFFDRSNSTEFNITSKKPTSLSVSVKNITVGEDAVISVTVEGASAGDVTLNMAGNPQTKAVVDGKVEFTVSDLIARNYHLTVTYLENAEYLSSNATANFAVNKKNSTISIKVSDIPVGAAEIIEVTVPEDASGIVLISVAGIHIYAEINESTFTVSIPNLALGNYTAVATYQGDDNYNGNATQESFKVTKTDIGITIEASNIVVGQAEEFTITTSEDITEVIIISVGGENYTTFVENGKGKFTVYNLAIGNYTAYVYFQGNSKYDAVENSTEFEVFAKKDSEITIDINNRSINVGDELIIYVNVTQGATGTVSIVVAGDVYNVNLEDGRANLTLTDLTARQYHVTAYYNGDLNYMGSNATDGFEVKKIATSISFDVADINVGQKAFIYVYLSEETEENITVHVNGVKYILNNYETLVEVSDLPEGTVVVSAEYEGNDRYTRAFNETTFSVTKNSTAISVKPHDIEVGQTETVVIQLAHDINGVLEVKVGDISYAAVIKDGVAKLDIDNLAAGKYDVNVTFYGNDRYFESAGNASFTVNQVHEFDMHVKAVVNGSDVVINVTLPDDANGEIYTIINGENYTGTVVNGKGIISISQLPGKEYDATVYFNGDDKYVPASADVEFAINKVKPNMNVTYGHISVGDDAVITVTLPEDANGNVTLNISGTSYSKQVKDGIATFTISGLAQGLYPFTVIYPGDDKYLADDKFLELTVSKIYDYKMIITVVNKTSIHVGDNATITVTLPSDATGNVSITVGNKTYNTGELVNGTGSIVVECPEKAAYVVTAEYIGDDKYDYIKETDHLDVRKIANYPVDVEITNATVGENATITVILPEDTTGNVTITIGDETHSVELINGTANLTVNVTKTDETVVVMYPGDDKYESSRVTTDLSGNKITHYDFTIEGDIIQYGETAYVRFYLPEDAYLPAQGSELNASVTIIVESRQPITVYLTSSEGFAIYDRLPVGEYAVSVRYNGNDKYAASTRYDELIVNKISDYDMGVEVNEPEIGENLTFIITLPEDAGGNVSVTIVTVEIGNVTYEVKIINGTGNISIPTGNFSGGEYDAIIHYTGDDRYDNITKIVHVDIVKVKNYRFDLDVHDIHAGENETVTITLPEDVTATITVYINGIDYTIDVVNGTGARNITGLKHGVYDVEAVFEGNSKYASDDKYDSFIVSKVSDYQFDVIHQDAIKVGDNLTVEVTLPQDIKGNVTVTVDNKTFTSEITDGKAVVNATGLSEGIYHFTVSFTDENEKYAPDTYSSLVVVSKNDVELNPVYADITVGDEAIIEISDLPEDASGNVVLLIDGKTYSEAISGGKVKFVIPDLDADNHTFIVSYDGDDKYNGDIYSGVITANKESEYEWDFNVSDIKVGEDEIINITLPGDANGDLIITIGNISYHKASHGGDTTYVISGLASGTYDISIRFSGNYRYESSTISKSFNVTKNTVEMAIELKDYTVVVTLPEDATGDVTIGIGNKTETVRVLYGTAVLDVSDLLPGDYTVNATYGGNGKYFATNASEDVNIPKVSGYDIAVEVSDVTVGENATIEVTLPDDATGYVNITVNGKTTPVEIVNGSATLEVPASAIGENNVTVTYGGDDRYECVSQSTTFHTKGKDLAPEVVIGENGTIIIKSLENATGNVTVIIDNETVTVPVENGTAIIESGELAPGNHTIVVVYEGDDTYGPVNTTFPLDIAKVDATIELTVENIIEGAVEVIRVEVPGDATGIVLIDIGGTGYYKNITDGKVTLEISGLTEGHYDVQATYVGDSRYNNVSTAKSFTVHKVEITGNVSGNQSSIIVEVPENETGGNVTVIAGDKNYTANITNGTVSVDLSDLEPGVHNVTVIYVDKEGNPTVFNTTISIPKWNATIELHVIDIEEGETELINITVPEDATGVVLIDVNGIGYYVNITDGKASFAVPGLKEGNYPVRATYMGDDKYQNATAVDSFNVNPVHAQVTPDINITVPDTADVGDVPVVNVTLPEDATGNVSVFVDGKKVAEVPVVNGTAVIPLDNLPAGDHVIDVKYSGDDNYAADEGSAELTVNKVDSNINGTAEPVKEGETAVIEITLPEDAGGIVLVDIAGKKYYADVKDGKATVEVDGLKEGNYTASVSYPGDGKYAGDSIDVPVEVKSGESSQGHITPSMNITLPEDSQVGDVPVVNVSLPEDATGNVSVYVDGKKVAEVPVVNGTAAIPLNDLPAGDHAVEARYSGDDKYAPASESGDMSVGKVPSDINVTADNIYEGEDAEIIVDVPEDATGFVLVDVDGKGYYAHIEDGQAVLNVSGLKSGNHTVKVTFPGDSKYANETITKSFNVTKKSIATLIVVEKKFTRVANDWDAGERGAFFYGVLMDTDGNLLANKKVQIAVNGPIYNVTTDDQGRAGLQVNLQNANTYTYALFFAGDGLYNASHIASTKLTVVKKTTSITASAKTFKASAKTKKYTVTLKTSKNPYNGKTYLSAGKKITLKVNGKTYTAKTNAKGVATFNLKLTKKATYVAKVSFAGDKTYDASSKSVKIKIS